MVKVISIILYIVAGFFFYMVSLLGFFNGVTTGEKWGIMIVFTVPSVIFLCGGLALTRFRCWKRDAGVVLLSASGFTSFLVFSIACVFANEEARKMMPPDTITMFNDFFTGGAVIVAFAALGGMLVKAGKRSHSKLKENM